MNILIVCSAGMSSSSLVHKMRQVAKMKGYDSVKIGSCPSNQLYDYINEADMLLITPQLIHLKGQIEKQFPHKEIRVISQESYGRQDVDRIFQVIFNHETTEIDPFYSSKTGVFALRLSGMLGGSHVLTSVSSAFITLLPVTIIGSFALLILRQPVAFINQFIVNTSLDVLLQTTINVTTNMVSLYIAFFVAFYYAEKLKVSPLMSGLNSIVCFFLIIGRTDNMILIEYFGAHGLFSAFFTAIISTRVFWMVTRNNDHLIKGVKYINSEKIVDSFIAILPIFFSVLVFVLFVVMLRFTPYNSLPELVNRGLQDSLVQFAGNNIISDLFLSMVSHVLWFFGIHGGSIVGAVTKPIYSSLSLANLAAFGNGEPLPYIINSQFRYTYILGGAGSTLGLVILMARYAKSETLRKLGKISLPLGIFFINETIIFGLPIVLNFILLLPFVFIPLFTGWLTYIFMKLNIIPFALGIEIPWTTPPIISGFIQGGYKLALWQIVILVISIILWYPFFKILDKKYLKEENK